MTKEQYPNATGSGDTGRNNDGLRGEVGLVRGLGVLNSQTQNKLSLALISTEYSRLVVSGYILIA